MDTHQNQSPPSKDQNTRDQKNLGENKTISRRRLLQIITATSGAVVASSLVPNEWVKPVVDVGTLPAYAQVSPRCVIVNGLFRVECIWNTESDVDLRVLEVCSNITVAPKTVGSLTGHTIRHTGDDDPIGSGLPPRGEIVEQITANQIYSGDNIYEIYVGHNTGPLPTQATVTITTDAGTQTITRDFTASTFRRVGTVTFPGGAFSEQTGSV